VRKRANMRFSTLGLRRLLPAIKDGAAAVVMTRTDCAKGRPKTPVYLLGAAMGITIA
jgi:hypothetical protein